MPSIGRYSAVGLALLALLAPLAGATTVQSNGPGVPTDDPAVTGSSVAQQGNASNYTRLYVEDGYRSADLKPGENTTFEVTVENGEDEPVTISPRLVTPRVGERPVRAEWVTITPSETTIQPDEEATVTVEIAVPSDAEMARYRGSVAFTDETITYPGRPPQPVHAARFAVEVRRDPTVFVVPLNEEYAQLQAGESYTHTVRVNNTGDGAVRLDPTVRVDDRRRHRRGQETADRDWFTVEAPARIPAGESATVEVTVDVPAGANPGDYGAEVNLGLRDPARNDRSDYWQRVDLRFQVWKQPEEPFTETFTVSESTQSLTVQLSAGDRPRRSDGAPAEFEVTLVGPDGETYEPSRVEVRTGGYVDLADRRRYPSRDGAYSSRGGERVVRYRLEEPAAGEWTVRIMPRNAVSFRYELVRDEAQPDSDPGETPSPEEESDETEATPTPTPTD